ncbi:hypothetical protein CXP39_01880 [Mesoplasma syrphidae]|uniref:Uncharacterized protein n=1 Tax=Mesoplasma syrphidae TaxID=225999 RepID=A0A2K9BUZ5_9MOLU|nr:hypothetical protein [Mesoplasma syrphidae]AUF83540.1 hypothetical protein CXP39_01880 [Mesoplasma syrphidae]
MLILQSILGIIFVMGPLYLIFEIDYSAASDKESSNYKETYVWFVTVNLILLLGITFYLIIYIVFLGIKTEDHLLNTIIFSTMMIVLWSIYLANNLKIYKVTKNLVNFKKIL